MNTSAASLRRSAMGNKLNKTKSDQNYYNSKAIMMFSSVSKRVKVAQLQLNTDLNKPPLNFLTNEAQNCGVYHNLSQSDEFTSYQTANMFPNLVGDIDIISNSTNIKKLFKIPYSGNSVSMLVHRIENTLLIDNYDVDNNLIAMRNDTTWLNNIFNRTNLKFSELQGKRFTSKNKSFRVIQEETLVSKFLHHSIGDSIDCDENNQLQYKKLLPLSPTWLAVSLPKLTQGDKYPTKTTTHRMYNQYMLWAFEGLQFLLGSDMAIFNGDNNSQLSLRLRDMSKPMNALTGMDYWLDNLVCNVNELLMCYHLNGIVKYNKTVLTKNIPHLNDSTFSPNDVKVAAKNLISFLKSNATNVGHTYWLLKEKNSDVLKLYDLTFLNSNTIYQNLFTIPIAMLLYRVVRNTKHNQNNGRPSNSNLNHTILVDCLTLLNETKYPEIVASVCYLLSDIFIPININVKCPNIENLIAINSLALDDNANEESSYRSYYQNGVCSIDVNNVLQPSREKDEYPKFEKFKSKPAVLTMEKRCKKALYYVGRGLTVINYEKKPDVQVENEENVANVAVLATSVDEKTEQNNNRRGNKINIAVEDNEDTVFNTQHSSECFGSKTYIWDKGISFFYKACVALTVIAEKYYLALRFGKALKNFRFAYRCQMFIFYINGDKNLFGYLLERVSVCCLLIIQNRAHLNQYINEMNAHDDCYHSVIKEFLITHCEVCRKFKNYAFIPNNISTIFCLLNSAESCYQGSVAFGSYKHNESGLYEKLIGSVYVDCTTEYLEKMSDIIQTNCDFPLLSVNNLIHTSRQILTMAVRNITAYSSIEEITKMYMNMGKWNTYVSYLYSFSKYNSYILEKPIYFLKEATEWHSKALAMLKNDPDPNLNLWIEVSWMLFSAAYDFAIANQSMVYNEPDTVTDDSEKNVLELLTNTFMLFDLHYETKYLIKYKLRVAHLHERVAVVYLHRLRRNMMSEQKKQITYRECKLNFNQSYEMYLRINQPVESLDIILALIIADEVNFKGVTSVKYKIKMFVSIGNTLKKCVPTVLQKILAMINDNPEMNNLIDKSTRERKISILLQKIQDVLKKTIKGVLEKNRRFAKKLSPVYRESLKKKDEESQISHLLRIVTEIVDIIKFMN